MASSKDDMAFNSLIYNDVEYNGKDQLYSLVKRLDNSANIWEKDIALFLKVWLNDSDQIELFTSGSTGKPKKVIVQKDAMLASAQRTLSFFNLRAREKVLLALSANYIAGKMMIVRAIVGGLNLISLEIDSNPLKRLNQQVKFTALVPTQVWQAINESKDKFALIDNVIIGGAALDKELAISLGEVNCQAWETYGMTETVSHIAVRKVSSTIDAPFEVLENISIDIDDRSCLNIDLPDMSGETIQTNDVVELTSENSFYFLGRYDNVINTGGLKVFPEEVERLLEDKINKPFVISSLTDEKWGQKVVVIIESSNPIQMDKNLFFELKTHQRPKEIFFQSRFPRTESGKILRRELKRMVSLNSKDN